MRRLNGESQARNRYSYFASIAKKEGYVQISGIFEETADNEKEHAKRMFKFLEGGMVEIAASYPAGKIGTTARTWPPAPPANTRNARFCTRDSQKRLHGGRFSRGGDNVQNKSALPKAARKAVPGDACQPRTGKSF